MRTKIVKLDPMQPEQAFRAFREVMASGGVAVYPTDTFYALGADPRNAAAVKKLFTLKGRETHQPILLLLSDRLQVDAWAAEITPQAARLIEKFWPGPLTLVFRARPGVLPDLTANTGTIGLRVPGNAATRNLLAYAGHAVTGTSANRSGGQSPRTPEEAADVAARADLVLDGGRTPGGKPSTVVDVSGAEPRIVREGVIPARDIGSVNDGNRKDV